MPPHSAARARFTDAGATVGAIFAQLRPTERLTVSEWAEKYRRLDNTGGGASGPWSFDPAPYLRRPMDCLSRESPYSQVVVMGPSQCGKSEIGNNWLGACVASDPGDMIFVGPDKDIVRLYVVSQINKMIALTPSLRERMLPTLTADSIWLKQFFGMNFFAAWPVIAQLRARPAPKFRVDDFDAVPQDIDGEGSPLVLLAGRQTAFEGYEKSYVNSSPSLGADKGIEALVARGTDERFHVRCPECGEFFEARFDALEFARDGSPEDAAASVVMRCPNNGCAIEQRQKHAMMADHRWVGAGQSVDASGAVAGEMRRTPLASFRLDGTMGFASWAKLARDCRAAELEFERTQDEFDLRAFTNTQAGQNYRSRLEAARPVDADEFAARGGADSHASGTVPDGVVCLTAAVDVQGNRFAVAVAGWGAGFESWIIDRFDIVALEDGETRIRPASVAEHWDVLIRKVLWRRWPMARDRRFTMGLLNAAIDTGGEDGVTDHAFGFWHRAVALGVPATSITLIKGGNNPKARLLAAPTIDLKRQIKGSPEVGLYVPNVHRFKEIVAARQRRREPGPGFIHPPRDFPREYADEATAEEKIDGVWKRLPGRANETWDLLVYNAVALSRHSGGDASLAWVPSWCAPRRTESDSSAAAATDAAVVPAGVPPRPGAPVRPPAFAKVPAGEPAAARHGFSIRQRSGR
jgi:phage terminase large subunit GpA-like protein